MPDQSYPPAAQCVPLVTLASAVIADVRRWTAEHLPDYEYLPLVGAGLSEAVVAPWASPAELRLSARMIVWTYAFDDYLEQRVTELPELDAFLDRVDAIVRTGRSDDGDPILASLSAWQADLAALPGYPPLAALWAEKFASCVRGHRYDWVAGWARERGNAAEAGLRLDVEEYFDHVDSISLWQVHTPRWVSFGGDQLPDRLDVLAPALDDLSVAVRMANDLATIERERAEPGQNNILMYDGVTEDWVRGVLDDRIAALHERLAPLLAEDYQPAIGLVRLAEWSVGIYVGNDMRDVTG